MTFFEVDRLFSYWRKRPPLPDLVNIVARILGWKPEPVMITGGTTFEQAKADTADWFASPSRFFKSTQVH